MGNRHQHCALSRLIRILLVSGLLAAAALAANPVRFEIKLDPAVAPHTASGRLFVLMSSKAPRGERLQTGFIPGDSWITAMEIDAWKPGDSIHL